MRCALWVVVILCACAKMGPPQGGPIDKVAPQILSYSPARDALGVPLNSVVEIVFSEAMDQERTQEAIFVSPAGALDFAWRGRTLRLKLSLRSARTYVVTVGTGARDLRGNALEQSFSLAFSTGSRLDQGLLSGRVYKEHIPERGAYVWAYDLADFSGEIGVETPAYQTQSGVDGQYEFLRLAPGAYRLLAFVDADRDAVPSADEWVALPASDVVVGDSLVLAGDLRLALRESSDIALERIQAVHERAVLLIFSSAVDPSQLALQIGGLEVGPFYTAADARKVYALTTQQEAGRNYVVERVEVAGRALKWQERIRGSARPDRKAPQSLGLAVERVLPEEPVELVFSEAMEAQLGADIRLASDSTQVLVGDWEWLSPTRVVFAPTAPWSPGRRQLLLCGADWQDRARNAIADSVLALDFEVVEPTASLYGRIVGAKGSAAIRASNEKATRHYAIQGVDDFAFTGVLPGAYVLWAFVDENGDGEWNAGMLKPFVRPETYARYAKPVAPAAGQKVEDIELELR